MALDSADRWSSRAFTRTAERTREHERMAWWYSAEPGNARAVPGASVSLQATCSTGKLCRNRCGNTVRMSSCKKPVSLLYRMRWPTSGTVVEVIPTTTSSWRAVDASIRANGSRPALPLLMVDNLADLYHQLDWLRRLSMLALVVLSYQKRGARNL